MPLKDPEARREYLQQYDAARSEKRRSYKQEYGQEKRPERRVYEKQWRALHPEKAKEYWQRHKASPKYEYIKAYARELYHKHPEWREEIRQRNAGYREKRRQVVFTVYGGCCACCGIDNTALLTIDHIGGGGNAHRKALGSGGTKLYSWLIRQGFPDGFQILCYNCNCAKPKGACRPHPARPLSDHWYFNALAAAAPG